MDIRFGRASVEFYEDNKISPNGRGHFLGWIQSPLDDTEIPIRYQVSDVDIHKYPGQFYVTVQPLSEDTIQINGDCAKIIKTSGRTKHVEVLFPVPPDVTGISNLQLLKLASAVSSIVKQIQDDAPVIAVRLNKLKKQWFPQETPSKASKAQQPRHKKR